MPTMNATNSAARADAPVHALNLLICDDSEFARRQIARALPDYWAVNIGYADGGQACLDAIRAGQADVLFLDLNMPGMDGYEVLETIRREDLPVLVVVVSADVQPQARERVRQLGALDFLRKPVDGVEVEALFTRYGIDVEERSAPATPVQFNGEVTLLDGTREIANTALGHAADRLARLLDVFIRMPVPGVSMLVPTDLQMTLAQANGEAAKHVVCQGFAGNGLHGEALMVFPESDLVRMAALMRGDDMQTDVDATEVLLETAGIVIGACLNGITAQLNVRRLNLGQPVVLGREQRIEELIRRGATRWENALAIEMTLEVEKRDIRWDLLLLLQEESLPPLQETLNLLLD